VCTAANENFITSEQEILLWFWKTKDALTRESNKTLCPKITFASSLNHTRKKIQTLS
jgi:hypothetical protein